MRRRGRAWSSTATGASSSKSGSADVLQVLGRAAATCPWTGCAARPTEVGITFLFAQPSTSMRFAATARKSLAATTQSPGPPHEPRRGCGVSAIGVAYAALAPLMAGVFRNRGDRALAFRGGDGLDELTATAPSDVWRCATADPGAPAGPPGPGHAPRHRGGPAGPDAIYNAGVVRDAGRGPGTRADAVLLNAAAGGLGGRGGVGRGVVHGPVRERCAVQRRPWTPARPDVLARWWRSPPSDPARGGRRPGSY
ncbi:hypothetical protein QJS66_03460 [Kocuria rhizophila]|nr:hypothetical protein QJS66_03460 [Kocuria rhizophila]